MEPESKGLAEGLDVEMREIPGTRERSLCVSGRGGDQEVPLSEPQCGRT